MSATAPGEVTQLLRRWGGGDEEALVRLMPMVYEELRALASTHLRHERPGHTLRTPDLVNEAYLRLVDVKQETWESRTRFFSLASRIIRNILVDYARTRTSAKRGSGIQPLSLDEAFYVTTEPRTELIALDDALTRLAAGEPHDAAVLALRLRGPAAG